MRLRRFVMAEEEGFLRDRAITLALQGTFVDADDARVVTRAAAFYKFLSKRERIIPTTDPAEAVASGDGEEILSVPFDPSKNIHTDLDIK
jgi:hypothetical protein